MKRVLQILLFTLCATLVVGCGKKPQVGLERGEHLFQTCVPCHGPDGGGDQSLGAPAIAGMSAWYLEAQLVKFRDGVRGDHPDDDEGLRMRPMARTLSDEGDVESVVAFVSALPPVVPDRTLGGDATAGATSYALCSTCHGADGAGMENMNAPSLTDKDDWYLATQIGKFKRGVRGADPEDTTGAQMRGMAATLVDDKAVADVLAHIATLGN